MRIGIIEVGSRAIRLFVADFRGNTFTTRKTDEKKFDVDMSRVDTGAVGALWLDVEVFRQQVETFSCDRVMVYGTALCRSLANAPGLAPPGFVHVLSAEEEAIAAWAAGFLCDGEESVGKRYTIVDQGSGSTEIVSASWDGSTAKDAFFNNMVFGSQYAMQAFRASPSQYARNISAELSRQGEKMSRHRFAENGELYALGSVATRLAWMKIRNRVDEVYKPYLVNGTILGLKEIFALYSEMMTMYARDPAELYLFVDDRDVTGEESVRTISGTAFLMLVISKLGFGKVTVSARGTRHGMAALVARGII